MARDENQGGGNIKRRIAIMLILAAIILVTVVILINVLDNDYEENATFRITAVNSNDSIHGSSFPPTTNFAGSELNLNTNGTFSVRIVYFDEFLDQEIIYFAAIGTFTTETRMINGREVRGHAFHYINAYSQVGVSSPDRAPIRCGTTLDFQPSNGLFHESPNSNTVILNVHGTLFTFSI